MTLTVTFKVPQTIGEKTSFNFSFVTNNFTFTETGLSLWTPNAVKGKYREWESRVIKSVEVK